MREHVSIVSPEVGCVICTVSPQPVTGFVALEPLSEPTPVSRGVTTSRPPPPESVPNEAERHHDYLWRIHQQVPGAGEIVAFNRSHYEDVLVPVVNGASVPLMLAKSGCTKHPKISGSGRVTPA